MKNEPFDKENLLPPQLAKDLISLRESVHTNELLRSKLRKQLLNDIASVANERPHPKQHQTINKWPWNWALVTVGMLLLGLAFWIGIHASDQQRTELVEVVQQKQLFALEEQSIKSPPDLSADGRFLTFERNNTIWIYNIDSGVRQELLPPPKQGAYRDPSIKADASQIAVSIEAEGNSRIGLIDFRNRGVQVVSSPGAGFTDHNPVFSKDGRYIAFIRTNTNNNAQTELWIMQTDGTQAHKVIEQAGEPAWSPDGKKLAFTRTVQEENKPVFEIWTVDRDGSDQKKLAKGKTPVWSPNGKHIAYVNPYSTLRVLKEGPDGKPLYQVEEQRQEIWLMQRDGDFQTRLTNISVQMPMDENDWEKQMEAKSTQQPEILVANGKEQDVSPIWGQNQQTLFFIRQSAAKDAAHFEQIGLAFRPLGGEGIR